MTGFAMESADLPGGALSLEIRAVNSRFLDLIFKMGEDFRTLEPQIRERLAEQVKRGKVECRVNFNPRRDSTLPTELNTTLLARLGQLAASVQQAVPDVQPLQAGEILRWPGMLGESGPDADTLQQTVLNLLEVAITDFNASRAREGEKLKATILDRLGLMRGHVAALRPRTPAIVAAYREKVARRMEEILQTPDNERLHQEVALFAQKIDVDEELDRLLSHLAEVERVVHAGGAAGKRLDFLMQELHREANTLGSKSVSLELSQTSVDLKVLIEQMREQVQNIE
jgi:uncharacterized protein (TIGR00255 family)